MNLLSGPKRKFLLWPLGIVGVLLLMGLSFIFVEPPLFVAVLPHKDWDDYRRWRRVIVPKDSPYREFTPYSDELLADKQRAVDIFRANVGHAEELNFIIRAEDEITTQSLFPTASHSEAMRVAAAEFQAACVGLLKYPDYDQEVFSSNLGQLPGADCVGLSTGEFRDFLQFVSNSAVLESVMQMEAKDFVGASQSLERAQSLFEGDPYASFLARIMHVAIVRTHLHSMATLVESNPDPAFAGAMLNWLRGIEVEYEDHVPLNHPQHADVIGSVRNFQKHGIFVAISESQPMATFMFLQIQLQPDYIEHEIERLRGPDPGCSEALRGALVLSRADDALSNEFTGVFANFKRGIAMPFLYQIGSGSPNDRTSEYRKYTRIELDLLKIRLACILHAQVKGTSVTTWGDLVPMYFPEPMVDPFSKDGSPYLLDPMPRSVGLDGKDDRGDVIQDLQSAKKPNGDIELEYSEQLAEVWKNHR